MKNITINTDAGFYHIEKVGSFAYWVVSDGLLLKGSGMLKGKCKNPTECETKAICNAIHILLKSDFDFCGVKKIIINRDNINAKSGKNGKPEQQKLTKLIRELKKKCYDTDYPMIDFRHVKSHNGTSDKRSFVNDWCDKECTRQLREWKAKHKLLENKKATN